MNREEAKYYLQSSGFSEEQIDTIEKAFTSTDAISRQAVQDYIAKYLSQYLYNDVREAVEVIDEYIGELPPVNLQPKTGHWIMSDDGLYRPICDNCGAHPWKGYIPTVEEATEVFKYCPNCGCRMVEPQERSDKG